jgi:uncharacterized protein DUF1592/uncharacterized protein DUF1595/uncharacterized protein DUF1588
MRMMYGAPRPKLRARLCAGLAIGLGLLGIACGGGGPGQSGSGGIGGGGGGPEPCSPLPALERRVWRLSADQWGSAVKDLLGLAEAPVLSNRGGQAAFAFFGDASLDVDENFQYALYQAAQSEVLPDIAPRIAEIAPCSETTPAAQALCAQTFAETFGKKAFRRPLDATEIARLMAVFTQGAMQSYDAAIALMVQAVIISPSFIYRTELGPPTLTADQTGKFPETTLTPHEVASQLGFLFLGSVPDAQLMAAADDGRLGTAAGIGEQIDRLLALPAVEQHLIGIIIDWFNIRQMFEKNKNTGLFTALPPTDRDQATIAGDLLTSARELVTDALWTNATGTIDDLFTSQTVFANRRLAALYPGLTFAGAPPTSDTTFVKATWPAAQGRAGMLTHPALLWSASDPDLTSIVKRGKFVHDDVMCQDALPPPVDLTTPSAMNVIACKSPDGTTAMSTCDSEVLKSDARMAYAPCKTCHLQIDPYSRVLMSFGPIGNHRTADEAGRPIDPTVTFPAPPLAPQMVTGAAAFGQVLVDAGIARGCAVQKLASYAIGSMVRTYNTCELNDIRAQVQADGTIKSLFRQVALANFLRTRAGGEL